MKKYKTVFCTECVSGMDNKKIIVNDLLSFINSQKSIRVQGEQCPVMKSCLEFYSIEEMKKALLLLKNEMKEINIHVMLDTLPDDKKAVMDTIFALITESGLANITYVSEKLNIPSVSNLYLSLLNKEMIELKQFMFQAVKQQYFEMQRMKSDLKNHSTSIHELLQYLKDSAFNHGSLGSTPNTHSSTGIFSDNESMSICVHSRGEHGSSQWAGKRTSTFW